MGKEEEDIIRKRIDFSKGKGEAILIDLSLSEFKEEYEVLKRQCEPYEYLVEDGSHTRSGRHMLEYDQAATGLGYICKSAKERGMRIYLSGSGADEIHSDYGFQGTKFYPHSNFGGLFPENLETVFPWASVFMSTQRNYLRKEEYVAGAHSMEGRYPFLDTQVVQEFLWLKAEVKNRHYKHPIYNYLIQSSYPVSKNTKIGFSTLRPDQTVLLMAGRNPLVSFFLIAAVAAAVYYNRAALRRLSLRCRLW